MAGQGGRWWPPVVIRHDASAGRTVRHRYHVEHCPACRGSAVGLHGHSSRLVRPGLSTGALSPRPGPVAEPHPEHPPGRREPARRPLTLPVIARRPRGWERWKPTDQRPHHRSSHALLPRSGRDPLADRGRADRCREDPGPRQYRPGPHRPDALTRSRSARSAGSTPAGTSSGSWNQRRVRPDFLVGASRGPPAVLVAVHARGRSESRPAGTERWLLLRSDLVKRRRLATAGDRWATGAVRRPTGEPPTDNLGPRNEERPSLRRGRSSFAESSSPTSRSRTSSYRATSPVGGVRSEAVYLRIDAGGQPFAPQSGQDIVHRQSDHPGPGAE